MDNPETLQQTQQQEQQAQPQEKTFTQAEVDAIISRRLAKATKGMPDEAELNAFRAWKDSQLTEQQRWNTLTQERDTARNELKEARERAEQYERERYLLAKGVSADDVDYYAFKAGKLVSDSKTFEQAADEIINAHKTQETAVRVDFGGSLRGNPAPATPNDAMNALIRGAKK